MENFALKSIQHKVYAFTFLTEVVIHIELGNNIDKATVRNKYEELKAFFSRFFQIDLTPDELGNDKGISLDNGDGISYLFSLSHINVKIKRKAYKSFLETALTAAFPLKQYFYNALGLKYIDNIFILKRSLFPFNLDKNEKDPDTDRMWPVIFSKHFIDYPIEEKIKIPGAINPVEMRQIRTDQIDIALAAGVGASKKNPGAYGVVLDIMDRPCDEIKIGEGEFDNMLLRLNDKIFDVFHWVVSDKIISLMEGK